MTGIKKQSGFSVVEALIILVIVGVLGFTGYMVYKKQQGDKQTSTSQYTDQESTADDVQPAPAITATDDLDVAQKTLDETSLDSDSDSIQLDKELSEF